MKRIILLFGISIFVFACGQNASTNTEIEHLKQQLQTAQATIQKIESNSKGRLVHIVYADLKPDANKANFIKEVEKLEAIKVVNNLEIGTFKDVGDSRALSDYEIIFQMDFANEKEYQTYQAHPVHLALKKAAGEYLAAAPKTYDFIHK